MAARSPRQFIRVPSSLPRRLAAILYDSLIVIALLLIAAAVASPLDQGGQQALRDPFFTAYLVAVWFFYLALCWIHGGMTVGMRAWKIVLVVNDGGQITWRLCALRFVTALISAAFLGLGFLWSVLDRDKRCWHDIASGSALIRSGT